MASLKAHKNEPEPEPKIKLSPQRNDNSLEKLLDEYLKNLDKVVDKSDEVK